MVRSLDLNQFVFSDDQGHVAAAKREGITHPIANLTASTALGHKVEITFWIWNLAVDRGRHHLIAYGQNTTDRFERAAGANTEPQCGLDSNQ